MAIDIGGIKVVVELENGTLLKGLVKSEELTKKSGKKMEENLKGGTKEVDRMGKMANDAGRKLRSMFGMGALIGVGMIGLRAFYGAISDGVKKAVESNTQLKKLLDDVQFKFQMMFVDIGIWLIPIVESLAKVGKFIADATGGIVDKLPKRELEAYAGDLRTAIKTGQTKSGYVGKAKDIKDWEFELQRVEARLKIIYEKEEAIDKIQKEMNAKAKEQVESKIAKELADRKAELIKLTEDYNKSVASLADQISAAFGSEDVKKQVDELYKASAAIGEVVKAMEAAKEMGKELELATGGWVAIITAALSIIVGIARSLSTAAYNTDEITKSTEDLLARTEQYENKIKSINTDMRKITAEMRKQKALAGDTTEEQIRLLRQQIEETKKYIDTARGQIGSANAGQRGNYSNMLTGLNAQKSQLEGEIDFYKNNPLGIVANVLTFGAALATSEARLKVVNELITNTNTRIDAIDAIPDLEADIADWEADIAEYEADIRDIEQERLDLITEMADEQERITQEMRRQTQELLSQQAKLGIIDLENVGGIQYVLNQLRASGLEGLDLASAAVDLGISAGNLGRVTRIGTVQMTNYNATNNSVNLNGVLNTQTGA